MDPPNASFPLPSSTTGSGATRIPDDRAVFFFDIDNCLYPRSLRIQDLMAGLIDDYFMRHLSLPAADATALHTRYYRDYGLAISGLVKHHKVDPIAYNKEVDDALPLEGIIKRDESLINLLSGIDKTKCKLWLFTNAHVTHARRVVQLLGVEDFFEGLTYCDYTKQPLLAKPADEMFEKAEREAGVYRPQSSFPNTSDSAPPSLPLLSSSSGPKPSPALPPSSTSTSMNGISINPPNSNSSTPSTTVKPIKAQPAQKQHEYMKKCYFIDDSALNCRAAKARGWTSVHKIERDDPEPKSPPAGTYCVRGLEMLRDLFPQFWKAEGKETVGKDGAAVVDVDIQEGRREKI